MKNKLENAMVRIKRLNAYSECCNLIGRFHVYVGQGKMTELIGLWANRDDCIYATPWGCYEGIRGIERCFMVDYGDFRDPRAAEGYKGYFNYQGTNGDYIEVAADLQTARGTWQCEGCVTFGKEVLDNYYKNRGFWNYSRYGVDFVFEDGKWKIWHMRFVPIIWSPYDVPWGDCEPYTRYPVRKTTEDCEPMAMPIFNYSYDCNFAASGNNIANPEAYNTWAEVAPGYGYEIEKAGVLK